LHNQQLCEGSKTLPVVNLFLNLLSSLAGWGLEKKVNPDLRQLDEILTYTADRVLVARSPAPSSPRVSLLNPNIEEAEAEVPNEEPGYLSATRYNYQDVRARHQISVHRSQHPATQPNPPTGEDVDFLY